MGMPRVNLLLIAPDGVVRFVLESLLLDLHEPIARWRPGERLALPPTDGERHARAARHRRAAGRRSAPPARLARARRGPNAGRQHVVDSAAPAGPRGQLHRHAVLPAEYRLRRRDVEHPRSANPTHWLAHRRTTAPECRPSSVSASFSASSCWTLDTAAPYSPTLSSRSLHLARPTACRSTPQAPQATCKERSTKDDDDGRTGGGHRRFAGEDAGDRNG